MDIWNLIAERKIREAMDEGQFDHLEGTGAPIRLEENPYEDPAQRMAHRLLRNNGFAPAWIEEGKEIDAEVGRLRADRNRLGEDEFRRRVGALNRRIEIYNLKTPVAMAQRTKICADRS
jgi:hypothetical protein